MRVAKDELFRNALGHVFYSELAAFLADGRVEDDLKQQIAKFLFEVLDVAGRFGVLDRIKRFVSFFEQILRKRRVGLLRIPWAAAGCPEPFHHADEFIKFF